MRQSTVGRQPTSKPAIVSVHGRVGIPVIFESDDSESDATDSYDDCYGHTPPQCRAFKLFNKRRKDTAGSSSAEQRSLRSRRKLSGNVHLDCKFSTQDGSRSAASLSNPPSFKWQRKHWNKARDSERTWKRAASVMSAPFSVIEGEDYDHDRQHPLKVESRNRFYSLSSRPVKCHQRDHRAPILELGGHRNASQIQGYQADRLEFYNIFSLLIRLGNAEKADKNLCKQKSEEESLWQNELRDLLWLEIQAWRAGRTLRHQDEYVCQQRKEASAVLHKILEYRFKTEDDTRHEISPQVHRVEPKLPWLFPGQVSDTAHATDGHFCLSVFCEACNIQQSRALVEVEQLINELDKAIELYPSSRAFSLDQPLYGSEEFLGRVNALCLWYNITKHLRLKVDVLGSMLRHLGSKNLPWPVWPKWEMANITGDSRTDSILLGMEEEEASVTNEDEEGNDSPQGIEIPRDSNIKSGKEEENVMDSSSQEDGPKVVDVESLKEGANLPPRTFRRHLSRVRFMFDERNGTHPSEALSIEESPTTPGITFSTSHPLAVTLNLTPNSGNNNGNHSGPSDSQASFDSSDSGVFTPHHIAATSSPTQMETVIGASKYKSYVEKALRTKGLKKMLRWIVLVHRMTMIRAKEALKRPEEPAFCKQSSSPLTGAHSQGDGTDVLGTSMAALFVEEGIHIRNMSDAELAELRRYGASSEESKSLNLPSFRGLYLFLCRIPFDVLHECLLIRLEEKPEEPSMLSIRQLIQEFQEAVRSGIICRQKYLGDMRAVLSPRDGQLYASIDRDLEAFDKTLKGVLDVYLDYLARWVIMGDPATVTQKNVLEQEWTFAKEVCPHIVGGEAIAGNSFCQMASSILMALGEYLRCGVEDCFGDATMSDDDSEEQLSDKQVALIAMRRIQRLFHMVRERVLRAVAFAKALRKDLEVAAEFDILIPRAALLKRLQETHHVRIVLPHIKSHIILGPAVLKDSKELLTQLLDLTCASGQLQMNSSTDMPPALSIPVSCNSSTNLFMNVSENDGYLVVLKYEKETDEEFLEHWEGETMAVQPTVENILSLQHVEQDGLLLVVNNTASLPSRRRQLLQIMGEALRLRHEHRPSNYLVTDSLNNLKVEALRLSKDIIGTISKVEEHFDSGNFSDVEGFDVNALQARCTETLRQCYKLGFEYHKEILRLVTGPGRTELARSVVDFAKQWMRFATQRSDRGRGLRPRWAAQGLDFLITACEPQNTRHLSQQEFQEFKESINACISHVIGTAERAPPSVSVNPPSSPVGDTVPNSRSSSPASLRRSHRPSGSGYGSDSTPLQSPIFGRKPSTTSLQDGVAGVTLNSLPRTYSFERSISWSERVKQAVNRLENKRQAKLHSMGLLGQETHHAPEVRRHIRSRSVTFSWQRGVKIGQGRFGKVYVAINNKTGELMAMKEVSLLPNDHRAIRSVADELRIFEGIHHKHLVRHYGVEVHREEMLIFMEYCAEGTLEYLVSSTEAGLPEELIRRYTRQLLEAVEVLHENGIVHRDIKSANIFLIDEGNSLKLGDFGCAVKIKTHTTMVGELQGLVGTQAYMAPEVFTKTMSEGHGRAADVWSLACVVVEMASGKRPWHEYESNYAIMFRVGMGQSPPVPANLSSEGHDFLSRCFQHDPRLRDNANMLLAHAFVKVYDEPNK